MLHSLTHGFDFPTFILTFILPIVLIFSAMILHHKAFTPPNPPATTKRIYNSVMEKTFFRSLTFQTRVQKGLVWFVGSAEAFVILSKNFPSWKYSNTVLQHLAPNDTRSNRIGHINLWFLIGIGMIIAGGVLRWSCYRTLGSMFRFEVSIQEEHKLVTSGPYGVVRHPAYTGTLLIIAGLFVWQIAPGSYMRQSNLLARWGGKLFAGACAIWVATIGSGLILRIRTEDDMLAKEFGDQWKLWADRVPYVLLPLIY